ncbi:type II secretion system protein [Candidatus Kaiserbacteria bacterium]|nr:type II secretion system protein [Candidatus Kaiserbacteria bacterium]
MHMNKQSGFTLMETIVYIGLFGIIMAMGMLSVHQLLGGSAQVNKKSTVQDEQNFVLRKIIGALGSIDPTETYTPSSGTSATLSFTRYDGMQVAVRLSGTRVEMSENGGTTYEPITTDNVSVSNLMFTYVAPSGAGPAGIAASVTVDGLEASTTRYIRK